MVKYRHTEDGYAAVPMTINNIACLDGQCRPHDVFTSKDCFLPPEAKKLWRLIKIPLRNGLLVTQRNAVKYVAKGGKAMSKYTTGEIAKLCGVSVRTVQYYDSRNILVPSELSEGGRRLYSEQDLKRMKIICFLRNAGISINNIGKLLSEKDPGSVISILLEQQEQLLQEEVNERKEKLELIDGIRRERKSIEDFSVESIGDIAYMMEHKKKLKQLHAILLVSGIPINILQWISIILLISARVWWALVVWAMLAIPYAIWVSVFYFKRVVYICPQCHEIFKPGFKEALWARHTSTLRKLTCTCCGYHGFCVEVYGKEKKDG